MISVKCPSFLPCVISVGSPKHRAKVFVRLTWTQIKGQTALRAGTDFMFQLQGACTWLAGTPKALYVLPSGGGIKCSGLNFSIRSLCYPSFFSRTVVGPRGAGPDLLSLNSTSVPHSACKGLWFLNPHGGGDPGWFQQVCVCQPQMESVHGEGAPCQACVSRSSVSCAVTPPPITDWSSPLCSGCPPPPSMPFLLAQAWLPAQISSSVPVTSFCQELPGLAFLLTEFPVSLMRIYPLWAAAWMQRKQLRTGGEATSLLPPTQFSDL